MLGRDGLCTVSSTVASVSHRNNATTSWHRWDSPSWQPQGPSILTPAPICFVTSLSVHAAETRGSTKRLQISWTTPWEFVRKLSALTILPWVTLDRTPSLAGVFCVCGSVAVLRFLCECFLLICFLMLMCYLVCSQVWWCDVSWHEELPVSDQLWAIPSHLFFFFSIL